MFQKVSIHKSQAELFTKKLEKVSAKIDIFEFKTEYLKNGKSFSAYFLFAFDSRFSKITNLCNRPTSVEVPGFKNFNDQSGQL